MADANDDTVTTKPSSYLAYLPECYADADPATGLAFVAFYLKVFEKLLSGIPDGSELLADSAQLAKNDPSYQQIDATVANRAGMREWLNATVIGNLFYPRWSFLFAGDDATFMPPLSNADANDKPVLFDTLASLLGLEAYEDGDGTPTPIEIWVRSFFVWLGSTIGLRVDKNWSIDDSRKSIGQAFSFDRARGTPMGLQWVLNACLAAFKSPVDGVTFNAGAATVTQCAQAPLIVFDADTDKTRAFRLRDAYPQSDDAVVISDVVGPLIASKNSDNSMTFTAKDSELKAYVPWRFDVGVTLSIRPGTKPGDEERAVLAYYRAVSALLAFEKPALTTYVLRFTLTKK